VGISGGCLENYLVRLLDIWGSDPNDSITALRWIESTVERGAEEGLYLDFKQKSDRAGAGPNDYDRANLAKAISGFANTDGGLIVWGVKAKADQKDDPDVAVGLAAIKNLRTFQTALNSLSGELVNPPVGGVENRYVPKPGTNNGYVITVVPRRHDTLVQANAKTCKGFYIRSGSGFHQLPEPLIAEFYRRRPAPILRLSLELAEQAQFVEDVLEAENWAESAWNERKPWGQCTFQQCLAVEWCGQLNNEGLGTAGRVVVDLRVSPCARWEVINFAYERHHTGWDPIVYAPAPTTSFEVVASNQGVGKALDPIHPGQSMTVVRGMLNIPFEAFETEISDFEVSGFAYSEDAPPFQVGCRVAGRDLRAAYIDEFNAQRQKAPPATRVLPDPSVRRIRLTEEGDAEEADG
jgi:hypothetical protein